MHLNNLYRTTSFGMVHLIPGGRSSSHNLIRYIARSFIAEASCCRPTSLLPFSTGLNGSCHRAQLFFAVNVRKRLNLTAADSYCAAGLRSSRPAHSAPRPTCRANHRGPAIARASNHYVFYVTAELATVKILNAARLSNASRTRPPSPMRGVGALNPCRPVLSRSYGPKLYYLSNRIKW
jgi:hypothetical protein